MQNWTNLGARNRRWASVQGEKRARAQHKIQKRAQHNTKLQTYVTNHEIAAQNKKLQSQAHITIKMAA